MKEKILPDEVVNMFLGEVVNRGFDEPFLWNGNICATDAKILLIMEGEDSRYKTTALDIGKTLPKRTMPKIFDVEGIRADLNDIPLIPETTDEVVGCNECDGSGEITCSECGHERECEKCEGEGKITTKTKTTGAMVINGGALLDIDDAYFQQKYLRKLLVVADALNMKTFSRVSDANKDSSNEFLIGDKVRIIIMPVRK